MTSAPRRYGPVPSVNGTQPAEVTLWPAGTITLDRVVTDVSGARALIRCLQLALADAEEGR